jgi:hypothetical protein
LVPKWDFHHIRDRGPARTATGAEKLKSEHDKGDHADFTQYREIAQERDESPVWDARAAGLLSMPINASRMLQTIHAGSDGLVLYDGELRMPPETHGFAEFIQAENEPSQSIRLVYDPIAFRTLTASRLSGAVTRQCRWQARGLSDM